MVISDANVSELDNYQIVAAQNRKLTSQYRTLSVKTAPHTTIRYKKAHTYLRSQTLRLILCPTLLQEDPIFYKNRSGCSLFCLTRMLWCYVLEAVERPSYVDRLYIEGGEGQGSRD
jgi:hypothetical protein